MLGLCVFFFVAGSWLALQLPVLPSLSLIESIVFLLGQGSVYLVFFPTTRRVVWYLCVFGLGLLLSAHAVLNWHMRKDTVLPKGQRVERCGRLVKPIRMQLPSQRWLFRLSSYSRVSSYHRYDQVIVHAYGDDVFHESDVLCLLLQRSRQSQFHAEQSLALISQGVVGHAQLKAIVSRDSSVRSFGESARVLIRHWVWQFSSEEVQHFLLALSIGDRSSMTKNDWSLFSKTGTSHLVAISGLHVMWVVLGLVSLLMSGVRLFSRIYESVPRGCIVGIFLISLCLLYASIIYPSPPSERALFLLAFGALCRCVGVRYSSTNLLWAVLFLSCMLHPFFFCQASACLSYWAAYCVWQSSWFRQDESCQSWLLMQSWMLVGLMPLSLYYFGQWHLIALFANSWVVPWVGLAIFPLALTSFFLFLCKPTWFSCIMPGVQCVIQGMFHCLHMLATYSSIAIQTRAFGVVEALISFALLFYIRLLIAFRAILFLVFPCILLLCLGWVYPKGVTIEKRYGVACREMRTIRSHDLSVLQTQAEPKSFYRYALPRYASRYHWRVFDTCVSSDRYAVFPEGLCLAVRVASFRHYRRDRCPIQRSWISLQGRSGANRLIFLPIGALRSFL